MTKPGPSIATRRPPRAHPAPTRRAIHQMRNTKKEQEERDMKIERERDGERRKEREREGERERNRERGREAKKEEERERGRERGVESGR